MNEPFRVIGIAREGRSPENPSEKSFQTDLRVSLTPAEVKKLVEEGCEVYIEKGAGAGIGFTSEDYIRAGAQIQSERELYANKDLIIKLKGPSLDAIEMMDEGSTILCFAHMETFPERRRLFREHGINVIAMEEILEHPERFSADVVYGKAVTEKILSMIDYEPAGLDVTVVGYSDALMGVVQQASRLGANVTILRDDLTPGEVPSRGNSSVMIYDSRKCAPSEETLAQVTSQNTMAFDLAGFSGSRAELVAKHIEENEPKEFGKRRIEFLHETGMCGARYGMNLLKEESDLAKPAADAIVVVLGYGNVAKGAIDEVYSQGVRTIHVLGRAQIKPEEIEPYLRDADIVINGIDLGDRKGKEFIITRDHITNIMQQGAVVIDLVGGSKTERSAIENVLTCTFLTDPHFEEHGIYFSAVWGWPMLGMMKESALNYSKQITDVLLGEERLIDGLGELAPGVARALINTQVMQHQIHRHPEPPQQDRPSL